MSASGYNASNSSPGSRKNSAEDSNSDVASCGSAAGSYSIGTRSINKFGRSIARPLEVPKLEVTSPHNQDLIRKYETRYNSSPSTPQSSSSVDNSKPPALPPRRNSKIIL